MRIFWLELPLEHPESYSPPDLLSSQQNGASFATLKRAFHDADTSDDVLSVFRPSGGKALL